LIIARKRLDAKEKSLVRQSILDFKQISTGQKLGEEQTKYAKIACKGWDAACGLLGFIERDKGNLQESKKLFQLACDAGNSGACDQLKKL
jgi:TPR repeat protein